MKKITIALLLTIMLLCTPTPVFANGFGISPSSAELEVPKDGSTTYDFITSGFTGTVTIGLEDIPLSYGPHSIDITDGETITVTFYGDGTNNIYEGKITFLASLGEQVAAGIKVRLTVHVNMTTEVLPPPAVGGGASGSGGGPIGQPPIFSNISTCGLTEASANICWGTDKFSTSQVEYWSSPSLLSVRSHYLVREHLVRLIDLTPGTIYYYRVMSQGYASAVATSEVYSFTTLEELSIVEPSPPEPVKPEPIVPEPVEPIEPTKLPPPAPPVPEPEQGINWGLIAGIVVGLALVIGGLVWWRRRRT